MGRIACLEVGGKVFAIGGWHDDEPRFSFKVSEIAYEMLNERPGLRPAPYLASRGMKWIQHFARPGLSDDQLRDYIRQSHSMLLRGLSKKKRVELWACLAVGALAVVVPVCQFLQEQWIKRHQCALLEKEEAHHMTPVINAVKAEMKSKG